MRRVERQTTGDGVCGLRQSRLAAGSGRLSKVPRLTLPDTHPVRGPLCAEMRSKQRRRPGQRVQLRRRVESIKKTCQTVVERFSAHGQLRDLCERSGLISSLLLQANIASKLEAARSTSLCCLRAQTALAGWRRPHVDLGVCCGFRETGIIGYDAREFIAHGESRCEVDCGKRPQADGLQSGSVVQNASP